MSLQTALLVTWLISLALSLVTVSALFLWGVRTGQFSEPDRARYLALPGEPPPRSRGED